MQQTNLQLALEVSMKNRTVAECGRKMHEKDSRLSELDMPFGSLAVLQFIRFYMQSVAHPASMAWLAVQPSADEVFSATYGPQIAARTFDTLQAVRFSRRSIFAFNSPTCPSCSQILTEHERRFMTAFECVRTGATGRAKTELIMLCEGNDVAPALIEMDRLSRLIAEFLSSGFQESHRLENTKLGYFS